MREVSSTGRQALTDMRRMLGVLRDEPCRPDGAARRQRDGAPCAVRRPSRASAISTALVERVRGTGLDGLGPAPGGPSKCPARPG